MSNVANESADVTLHRLLSLKSVVSTASSFTQRQIAAQSEPQPFREIGTSSIGKVFEHPGTKFVYKLPLFDRTDKIWNNYVIQKHVEDSFNGLPFVEETVMIPQAYWFGNETTTAFWDEYLERFPDTVNFPRIPRQIMAMERIFPLPKIIRNSLIDLFCPAQGRDQAKAETANKDCLIRPMLGRLKHGGGDRFFSCRNFKLHANQMEQLHLQSKDFVLAMAYAYAVLHYRAQIDGMDIEFVLGSSPLEEHRLKSSITIKDIRELRPGTSTFQSTNRSPPDFAKRTISLWLLDFDACNKMVQNEYGVEMAVKAFFDTDPYAPRPASGVPYIQDLWKTFKSVYLYHAERIGNSQSKKLSNLFVQKVENEAERRAAPAHSKETNVLSQPASGRRRALAGIFGKAPNTARHSRSKSSQTGGPAANFDPSGESWRSPSKSAKHTRHNSAS
jgi:hypothetical protein